MSSTEPKYGIDYIDNPPINAISAVQVRKWREEEYSKPIDVEEACSLFERVLRGLLTHPGLSSTARSVVEAALEE